jgi:hypothetical protein
MFLFLFTCGFAVEYAAEEFGGGPGHHGAVLQD